MNSRVIDFRGLNRRPGSPILHWGAFGPPYSQESVFWPVRFDHMISIKVSAVSKTADTNVSDNIHIPKVKGSSISFFGSPASSTLYLECSSQPESSI